MLLKVECDGYIKEEIRDCLNIIKLLEYNCGTTMVVNGITVEIYPHDVVRGVGSIHEDYLQDLAEVQAMREEV